MYLTVIQSASGFSELFGFFLFIIYLIIVLFVSLWIRSDAVNRGSQHPTLWGLAVAVLSLFYIIPGVIAILLYLYARSNFQQKENV
jgi:predicted branched-subunit amino acid permease